MIKESSIKESRKWHNDNHSNDRTNVNDSLILVVPNCSKKTFDLIGTVDDTKDVHSPPPILCT